MKKQLTIVALAIGFSVNAQNYSFSTVDIDALLTAGSVVVDDLVIDDHDNLDLIDHGDK